MAPAVGPFEIVVADAQGGSVGGLGLLKEAGYAFLQYSSEAIERSEEV